MDPIKEKNIKLILILAIAVVVVCSFRFGYMTFNDKRDVVVAENVTLQKQVQERRIKVNNEATYLEGIAKYNEDIKAISNTFAAGVTPEKSIMFLVGLQNATGIKVPTVMFGTDAQIFASMNVPSKEGLGVYAYNAPLSISYTATYDSLKQAVAYINENAERMNIANLSATFNSSTGTLSGNMTINMYSLLGTEKEYEAPTVNNIVIGTDNIFGTIE